MHQSLHALIVEDSKTAALTLIEKLRAGGYEPTFERVDTEPHMRHAFQNSQFDIVFCDYSMPEFSGKRALQLFNTLETDIPFIIVSGAISEETATDAMMSGAHDYLHKSNLARLVPVVTRELQEADVRRNMVRTHKALEQNERLFRSLLEAAPSAAIITKIDGTITLVNGRAEEMFGFTRKELLGTPVLDLIPEHFFNKEPHQSAEELAQYADENPLDLSLELTGVRSDSYEFPVEVRSSFIQADHGLFVINFITDITLRKHSEARIREQAALLDKAQDIIAVIDLDGNIIYWNKSASNVFGWSIEEALNNNADEILFNHPSANLKAAHRVVREKGEWSGELRQFTKEGEELYLDNRWTLVRDQHGTKKSILITATDKTEQKRLETEFQRSQRMYTIGELAGGIAHDLNNVLAPILMSVQMLRMEDPDAYGEKLLSVIERSARRGADMVKQVLTFVRGAQGERVQLQPRYLIKETAKMASEIFPKDITVSTDIPGDLHQVMGDRTQLQQVLMNLCVNARDAITGRGSVMIAAENVQLRNLDIDHLSPKAPCGAYVQITVSDTGAGIAPQNIKKIFKPFFTTKEENEGTGLGLAVVKTIVDSHDGFVDVYSKVGAGASFKVFIPAVETPEIQVEAPVARELPTGNGELILVVDDEQHICNLAEQILETFGYRVLTANDGIEAIQVYKDNLGEIDLVLLDMLMPNMNGPETIFSLTRLNASVQIIAASGLPRNAKEVKEQYENVAASLIKPFTAEKLLYTLHESLPRKPV